MKKISYFTPWLNRINNSNNTVIFITKSKIEIEKKSFIDLLNNLKVVKKLNVITSNNKININIRLISYELLSQKL